MTQNMPFSLTGHFCAFIFHFVCTRLKKKIISARVKLHYYTILFAEIILHNYNRLILNVTQSDMVRQISFIRQYNGVSKVSHGSNRCLKVCGFSLAFKVGNG